MYMRVYEYLYIAIIDAIGCVAKHLFALDWALGTELPCRSHHIKPTLDLFQPNPN